MTYEQIRHRIPEGIPKKVKKIRPIGPKNALVFFLVLMALFSVIGSIIQYSLGMVGVMITELFFLIASVLYVRRRGIPMKEVFPIRKPKLLSLIGTVVLWFGSYLMIVIADVIMNVFFSDIPANADADTILSADLNWFFLFFIVAILPPICEEAMHRGVIQYGLKKKIQNPWVMACVVGLIFGIFHLDPSKFLVTGLLGGVMAWILFRTNNMVYSSFYHFVHNGVQMILLLVLPAVAVVPGSAMTPGMAVIPGVAKALGTAIIPGQVLAASPVPFETIQMMGYGVAVAISGMLLPFVLYTGDWLLMHKIAPRRQTFLPQEKQLRKLVLRKLFGTAGCFVAAGILIAVLGLVYL